MGNLVTAGMVDVAVAVAAEREACALIAEEYTRMIRNAGPVTLGLQVLARMRWSDQIAASIRQRNQTSIFSWRRPDEIPAREPGMDRSVYVLAWRDAPTQMPCIVHYDFGVKQWFASTGTGPKVRILGWLSIPSWSPISMPVGVPGC